MTIQQALDQRIRYVRLPEWEPSASLELPLLTLGGCGPWATVRDVAGWRWVLITRLVTDLCDQYEACVSASIIEK